MFFLALTGKDLGTFSPQEKWLLVSALLLYVATAILCLLELNVDARRFFYIAKQLELPEGKQAWARNERYKKLRLRLIFASYVTATLATIAVIVFLVLRIA